MTFKYRVVNATLITICIYNWLMSASAHKTNIYGEADSWDSINYAI